LSISSSICSRVRGKTPIRVSRSVASSLVST